MNTFKLVEVIDGKITLHEICYTSKTLKEVMRVFKKGKNYEKILLAFKYLTCPFRDENPYVDTPEAQRQDIVLQELGIDFSIDEPAWEDGLKFCFERYMTSRQRFFKQAKIGLEKLGESLEKGISGDGRDSNFSTYVSAMKSIGTISAQFAQVEKAYYEELGAEVRGNVEIGYDET